MITLERYKLTVFCKFEELSEVKAVQSSLSFFMPNYEWSEKFQNGWWDGKIKYFDLRHKSFPVGLLEFVIAKLDKNKIKYKLVGFTDKDVSWVKFSKWVTPKERDYQRASILMFLKRCFGIIKVPTRGGKTIIGAELISLVLRHNPESRIVWFTDASDLYTQTIKDLSKYANIPKAQIGTIQGNTVNIKQVTVAMIQSVQSKLKVVSTYAKDSVKKKENRKNVLKMFDNTTFLIIDEIHEYSTSKPRMKIIENFKHLSYQLALSAEPYKDDKIAKLNVKKLTGGIIYTIEEKELEQRKVLAQNKVLLIINEYTNNGDNTYRDTYDEVIINNKNRNRLVAGVLELCKLLDIKILALFASKKHGYIIEKKTGVKFLSGDSSGEERETVKEYFLKGKGKQLLASWIWKKGITLPEVQVLLNVDGGKEKSLVIQIRGRVLGMAEGKSRALFVDFIDIYGDYFSEHALERIKVYEEKVGKDNIDVLESGSLDFYEMLESYMMDWFNIKSNDKGRV